MLPVLALRVDLNFSSGKQSSPGKQRRTEVDLERILRDCAEDNASQDTFLQLKDIASGIKCPYNSSIDIYICLDDHLTRPLVKGLIHSAKRSVMKRCRGRQHRLLETELYAKWLDELQYIVTALTVSSSTFIFSAVVHLFLQNALNAKVHGTRKRIPSLGRPAYAILYNLIDEFIDEVNIHHDICSTSDSGLNLYPPTLSLVEEAKDPSTDDRSEESVKSAEEALKRFDQVMANAVRRYKAERGWCNATLAEKISTQEHTLAKGCCLLCEQTGYGAEENDMGDTLMKETRGVMTLWKNEVGILYL